MKTNYFHKAKFTKTACYLVALVGLLSCSSQYVAYIVDDDLKNGTSVKVTENDGYSSIKEVKSKNKIFGIVKKSSEGFELRIAPKGYVLSESDEMFTLRVDGLQPFDRKQIANLPFPSEKYCYRDSYDIFVFSSSTLDEIVRSPRGKTLYVVKGSSPYTIYNNSKNWEFSKTTTKVYFNN
jgi:hypothetical protein